jgi:glycosyltransferase involved in cell wall biosynthesis
MKVCFLVGTLARGGAERQLIFMLQALKAEGVDTRLLCLTSGEAHEGEIRDLGVEPEWVGTMQNRVLRLRKIIGALKKKRADIIQSSHFYTNIYAAAAGKYLGITSIGAVRSNLDSELAADRIFAPWQLRLPDHLIANSENSVSRAVSMGIDHRRINCVRNVVELGPLNGVAKCAEGRPLNILFVGRLSKEKRPEWFIDLADHVSKLSNKTQVQFLIAGDGPLRTSLESMVLERGLSESIHFLGEQADMGPIYSRADILVLTSVYEGTPNVLLEAMAHRIPVVATRVGGVPEIVGERCGLLVDPLRFSDLAAAVERLIREPDLRCEMGNSGRQYVERNHSISALQRQLTGIYERLREMKSA